MRNKNNSSQKKTKLGVPKSQNPSSIVPPEMLNNDLDREIDDQIRQEAASLHEDNYDDDFSYRSDDFQFEDAVWGRSMPEGFKRDYRDELAERRFNAQNEKSISAEKLANQRRPVEAKLCPQEVKEQKPELKQRTTRQNKTDEKWASKKDQQDSSKQDASISKKNGKSSSAPIP